MFIYKFRIKHAKQLKLLVIVPHLLRSLAIYFNFSCNGESGNLGLVILDQFRTSSCISDTGNYSSHELDK